MKRKKRIIFNIREWKYGQSSDTETIEKTIKMVRMLISKNYFLSFVSTCQGINGYIDDSKLAHIVFNKLSVKEKTRMKILDRKLSLKELEMELNNVDLVVGMRMHLCLMAFLKGIPFINLAYENKSFGIFGDLNLINNVLWYSEDYRAWEDKITAELNGNNSYTRTFHDENYSVIHLLQKLKCR